MGIIITGVNISKNPVQAGGQLTISVTVRETVTEPASYRLPYRLGEKKGGIK